MAKKLTARRPGVHSRRNKSERAAPSPRRSSARGKSKEPSFPGQPVGPLAARLRHPDDVVECLSSRLALVETAAIALREFEAQPGVGSICTALEQSIDLLTRAHEAVNVYLFEWDPANGETQLRE